MARIKKWFGQQIANLIGFDEEVACVVAFKSPVSAFALPMILEYSNFGDRLFMICTISIKMVPSN